MISMSSALWCPKNPQHFLMGPSTLYQRFAAKKTVKDENETQSKTHVEANQGPTKDTTKTSKTSKTCHMHRDLWPILTFPQSIWTSVPPSQYQAANHHDLSHQQVHHHRKSGHVKNTYLMHWHKQAVVAMSHPASLKLQLFQWQKVVNVHRKWVVSNTHLSL